MNNIEYYMVINVIEYYKILNINMCEYYGSTKILCDNKECEVCFNRSFASHEKSKYILEVNPRSLFKSSHVKYKFKCEECKHIFKNALNEITNKNIWCSFCARRSLCLENDCVICFNRSFTDHEKSKYIIDANPRSLFKNSNKKFKFKCEECKHIFEITLAHVTINNNWCNLCSNKALCDDVNCTICFNKSFASHEKSKYILEVNPRSLFKSSNKKHKFKCNTCSHIFEITLAHVTIDNNWCSYCSSGRLCSDNDCIICFNKSFASHEKAKYIIDVDPRSLFKNSGKKYKFKCNLCENDYESTLDEIAKGKWCGCQSNKTETKVLNFLKNKYNVETQKRFDELKNRSFDFYFPDLNVCLELDGRQHFQQVSNWQSPTEAQKLDKLKMDFLLKNKISIVRILQEDVWEDKYDWQLELTKYIKKYKSTVVKFIAEEDCYDAYSEYYIYEPDESDLNS